MDIEYGDVPVELELEVDCHAHRRICLKLCQTIGNGSTYPIVAELMIEQLHPLNSPLFTAVAPRAGPFRFSPWIPVSN